MKGGQKRAQRRTPADAFAGCVKVIAVFHAVVQKLPQQVQQDGVGDMTGYLVVQALFIDGGVVPLYIGAKDKGRGVMPDMVMNAKRALLSASVTFEVFAEGMNGKLGLQCAGQFYYQRIPG